MEAKSVVRFGVAALVAAAVMVVAPACGQGSDGGTEEAAAGTGGGGTGGDIGEGGSGGNVDPEPTVEELCTGICQPMVDCEMIPADYLDDCVDLCAKDPSFEIERGKSCVACMEEVQCSDILLGCVDFCEPPRHDLQVDVSGLEGEGELFVAVIDDYTNSVAQIASGLVEDGAASVGLPQVLIEGRSIRIDAFLDTDLDGACTDGDRTWTAEVTSPTADAVVELLADAAEAPAACGSFEKMDRDFAALGTGFDDYDGKNAVVALKATFFGYPSTMQGTAQIQDGTIAAPFGRVLASYGTYSFVWFVDVDGDGRCSPSDLGGSVEVPAPYETHVLVEFDPSSGGAPACDQIFLNGYDLTLEGSGYDDFDGELAQASLVHAETLEYRASGEGRIADGSFVLTIPQDLAYGHSHKLSLWIDTSGDGFCGEGDAAWWFDLPATEGNLTTEINYSPAVDLDACKAQVQQSPF